MKTNKILSVVVLLFVMVGCADLNTENPNRGDLERVLSNPDDFVGVVEGQFNSLWHSTQFYNSNNAQAMGTTADAVTSSWGNFGMQDMSSEPRIALDNTQTYRYAVVFEYSYENNNAIIGAVNDVLRIMDADPELVVKDNGIDVTLKTKAEALYAQGIAYGYLALTYDKAKFVDETVDLADVSNLPLEPYDVIMTNALAKLDLAVTTAKAAPDFNITAYNGIILTRDDFVRLIRTMQAKFMIYVARTATENAATDWVKVLSLANQGINIDFSPIGDGNTWWDGYKYYGTEEGWARVDYRIINSMDPSQPSRFPTDNSHPLPPAVGDDRLVSDMEYYTSIPFRAERGLYHYSHYDYTRYDYHFPGATGVMPHTTVVENNLIKAEASMMTGDNATAAQLINLTRVARGGLGQASAGDSDLYNKILHERFIELFVNMGGIPFYDRRRTVDDDGSFKPYSGLQPGTFRQFPLPAKELNILGEELYTFGGSGN
jgi:starch-binding outer membrane protein, SusD/RagB family